MKQISYKEMQKIQGGDFVEGVCAGIAVGSGVYVIGIATNWWNPVGWVSIVGAAADVACGIYVMS